MVTFIPEWVGKIDDAVTMPAHDLNAIKKLLRVIAGGARLVMREYARLKEVSEGDPRKGSKELRQLSINQFAKPTSVPKQRKVPVLFCSSNSPPDSIWEGSSDPRHLIWGGDGNPGSVDESPKPEAAERGFTEGGRIRSRVRLKPNPWKGGLSWFSPRRQGSK